MSYEKPYILGSKTVFENQWLQVIEKELQFSPGLPDKYYSVQGPSDIVSILALDSSGCALLVSQYRHAVDAITIDIPGGAVEKDETIEQAARRECLEETGYQLTSLTHLVSFFLDSGQKNSKKHIFYAQCEKSDFEQKDKSIVLLRVPFSELLDQIVAGKYNEPSLILAVLYATQFTNIE